MQYGIIARFDDFSKQKNTKEKRKTGEIVFISVEKRKK